jgi:hypothetical protein
LAGGWLAENEKGGDAEKRRGDVNVFFEKSEGNRILGLANGPVRS